MTGSKPLDMGVLERYTPTYRRPRGDSNAQPTDSKSGALSIELQGLTAELYLNVLKNRAQARTRVITVTSGGQL